MKERLHKVKKILQEDLFDAVLISSTQNIYYITGYGGFVPEERDAYVLITKDAGYIFTHALYAEAMGTEIPHLDLVEITRDEPFEHSLQRLVKKHHIKTFGYEDDNLTVAEFNKLASIQKNAKPINLSRLRSIKNRTEAQVLQKACGLTDKAYEYILMLMKPGVTEKEIEYAFRHFFSKHNSELSFRPIVAFGKNASVPHHLSGNTKLQKHDTVLLDFGAKVEGYCADESRTFFIGEPAEKHKKMFQAAYDAQQKVIEYIENCLTHDQDISAYDVDALARDYIVSQGYPAFPYSLGHGVGLDVHEYPLLNPRSKAHLKAGMTFTLEPGIHIPGEFGVRIEDVFIIEGKKLRKLTQSKNDLTII